MNWRDLPPLASLRAFSAFSQSGSVKLAGVALNVSHAAISQHLRALEAHLGLSLVDRSGRALSLTQEGDQLARALDLGFGAIGAAVQDLKGADADRPLHISCTSSFAASWLMPRLPGFRALHPEINLMLDPSPELVIRWYRVACGAAAGGTVGRTRGQNRCRFTTVRVNMTRCRAAVAATAAASAAVTQVSRCCCCC